MHNSMEIPLKAGLDVIIIIIIIILIGSGFANITNVVLSLKNWVWTSQREDGDQ